MKQKQHEEPTKGSVSIEHLVREVGDEELKKAFDANKIECQREIKLVQQVEKLTLQDEVSSNDNDDDGTDESHATHDQTETQRSKEEFVRDDEKLEDKKKINGESDEDHKKGIEVVVRKHEKKEINIDSGETILRSPVTPPQKANPFVSHSLQSGGTVRLRSPGDRASVLNDGASVLNDGASVLNDGASPSTSRSDATTPAPCAVIAAADDLTPPEDILRFYEDKRNDIRGYANCSDRMRTMKLALEKRGNDVFEPDEDGDTPFMKEISSKCRNFEQIVAFTDFINEKRPGSINHQNKRLQTALYNAVYDNEWTIVALLVENGADPSLVCNIRNDTPLHFASRKGYMRSVVALLSGTSGCSNLLSKVNTPGETPLETALRYQTEERDEIVKYLLRKGAKIDVEPSELQYRGKSLLHYLISCKELHLLKIVLKNSRDAQEVLKRDFGENEHRSTLFHFAMQQDLTPAEKVQLAKLLWDNGASARKTDYFERSPIDYVGEGNTELRSFLVRAEEEETEAEDLSNYVREMTGGVPLEQKSSTYHM